MRGGNVGEVREGKLSKVRERDHRGSMEVRRGEVEEG